MDAVRARHAIGRDDGISLVALDIEIYLNGYNRLLAQFKKNGIKYKKVDNCFVEIGDIDKAGKIIKSFKFTLHIVIFFEILYSDYWILYSGFLFLFSLSNV